MVFDLIELCSKVLFPLYCFEEFLDCGEVVYGCGASAVHARFPMQDVSGGKLSCTCCAIIEVKIVLGY